jgi:hypothetical protein
MLHADSWRRKQAPTSMEILIPGLALVALMVYVSTRIKRSAAKAFDQEIAETDEFTITKPAGFIMPAGAKEQAFVAYSKEFGTDKADSVRQVTAELRIHAQSLEEVCESIVAAASKVVSEQHLANRSMILETENIGNGIALETEYSLIEKNGKVFELSVAALPETKEEQQRSIDALLASFEVK